MFTLTLIIPTLNEEKHISRLLDHIYAIHAIQLEIIVVDGGSTDKTIEIVKNYNNVKLLQTTIRSRAVQLNLGAKQATGNLLYFVHADVLPPISFFTDIKKAVEQGFDFGCYRFKFDKKTPLLQLNSWFTQFDFMFCRGGDQTLFISKESFFALNGFNENYCIMEDFELIKRARKEYRFKIMPKDVIVSSRKYHKNSYFKVNLVNLRSYWMFRLGVSPQKIKSYYKKRLILDY